LKGRQPQGRQHIMDSWNVGGPHTAKALTRTDSTTERDELGRTIPPRQP
jgi:hypothetical protein